jgi:hypothetical protein
MAAKENHCPEMQRFLGGTFLTVALKKIGN